MGFSKELEMFQTTPKALCRIKCMTTFTLTHAMCAMLNSAEDSKIGARKGRYNYLLHTERKTLYRWKEKVFNEFRRI